VDFVVHGEGELALPQLIENIDNPDVPGISFKKGRKIIHNKPVSADIDTLAYPEFLMNDILDSEIPHMLPILLTRGCVGTCDFCFETIFWKGLRPRKAKDVVQEIKYQMKHDISNFRFNDCALNSDIKTLKDMCNLLISEDLIIKWGGNFRIDKRLDADTLQLLYDAGCRYLYWGVESVSEKVLQSMGKGISPKTIKQNIVDAHKVGLWVHLYLIVGYPTETWQEFVETAKFISEYEPHIDSFDASPFELHEEADIFGKDIDFSRKEALRRHQVFESIFRHKYGYPYSHLLEKDPIDYKNHVDSSRIDVDNSRLTVLS